MITHPKKILFVLIVWPALCRAAPTSQGASYPEKERDGNIPFVDVEMLPSKRYVRCCYVLRIVWCNELIQNTDGRTRE